MNDSYQISPEVQTLLDKGEKSKREREQISVEVQKLAEFLLKTYPDSSKAIQHCFEGAAQKLASDREACLRRIREDKRKANGG